MFFLGSGHFILRDGEMSQEMHSWDHYVCEDVGCVLICSTC